MFVVVSPCALTFGGLGGVRCACVSVGRALLFCLRAVGKIGRVVTCRAVCLFALVFLFSATRMNVRVLRGVAHGSFVVVGRRLAIVWLDAVWSGL